MGKSLIILSLLLSLVYHSANAQTPTAEEWTEQKRTQKKYLRKQIALLELYGGYLKKGYDIARKGLTTIHNIKDGEFNLHRDYFNSLKDVNPRIRNSAKVIDIAALQVHIIRQLKGLNEFCKGNSNFTSDEIQYVASVYVNMMLLCEASVSELLMVITSGESEMKDDERLLRIDSLYAESLNKLAFAKAFGNDTRLLAKEREKESTELIALKKQFDIQQ